jgi:hypothetical protein
MCRRHDLRQPVGALHRPSGGRGPDVRAVRSVPARRRGDRAGLRGRVARRRTDTPGEPAPACDGSLLWEAEGGLSTVGLAMATEVTGGEAQGARRSGVGCVGAAQKRIHGPHTLRPSGPAAPDRGPDPVGAPRPSGRGGGPPRRPRQGHGLRDLADAKPRRLGRTVEGADRRRGRFARHQAIIDAAFFYLNASTHAASPSATSIFGLATWHDYHYYYGHVMWDIDAFCVPPLLFSQPDAALAMLEFRKRGLARGPVQRAAVGAGGAAVSVGGGAPVGSGSRAGGRRQRRA